jgi:hypothetical protein
LILHSDKTLADSLVQWRAQDLARESAVGVATIRRAELVGGETSMTAANDLAVRRALEMAGVEFIDENGRGPGVRLRKPPQGKQRKPPLSSMNPTPAGFHQVWRICWKGAIGNGRSEQVPVVCPLTPKAPPSAERTSPIDPIASS